MPKQPTQQSVTESRPRPAHNLTENLPDLGELVPVDSFFNRYVTMLGAGQQLSSPRPGTQTSGPVVQSQGSKYQGQQGQPAQPSFRYPTTANYLAQLTGHDLNKQGSQGPSSLPVEQLDTSMQRRHSNGGPHLPTPPSAQADLLAYPSSSLVHFQQLLQAQAAANGFAPPQLEAQMQAGMSQSAALQAAQHAQQAASRQHQWLPPKGAATLAPPSDKSNPDPGSRHPSRSAAVSPSRYGSTRCAPGPPSGSPTSWVKPQPDRKGSGPVASPPGAPGSAQGDGSDMDDEGHSTGFRMPSGSLSRTNRTPRQQLQNKQAQQRYRERRKMKVTEMEQALAAMSQQVDELQGVMKQNVALQDKTLRLEQMLAERDLKIEQLGSQLKAGMPSTTSAQPNQDAASGPSEVEGRIPCNPAFDGMSDLKLEFQGQIMKLQQYIEANNLRHVDPLGSSVPQEILAHVTDMVEDGCRVCQRVQAEGIQVLSLITRDPHSLKGLASVQEREKWAAAVRVISLTPLQIEQVLIWREEHLRNMNAVYEQRQHVNAETIDRMQPETEGVPSKKMEGLQIDGYLPTAKANLELTGALDRIKENLKWEQKTVLQFNWVLVNRIMSPIQTALFMVHAWPSHCDCLALVNTVSAIKDELLRTPTSMAVASPASQHSSPQHSTAEPMQSPPSTQISNEPQGNMPQPSHHVLPEGSSAQSHSPAPAPLTSQVNPFASAFRPVLPSKRDSHHLNRSPSTPFQTPSAFQPVGTSPQLMGSSTLQTEPSSGSAQLPEPPQSADSFKTPASIAAS